VIEKAVILAAGSATRMQPQIEHYVKNEDELAAIRKGEKMAARFSKFPFLDYQLLNLVRSGLKKVNIVLKPEDDFFRKHYDMKGRVLFPEVEISYSFQEVADGTAHALYAAREFVGNERFLLLNGDNNYSAHAIKMIMDSPDGVSALVAYDIDGFNRWTKERLGTFAVIRVSGGRLIEIVEKPENPLEYRTSDFLYTLGNGEVEVSERVLTSMNLWCFTPDIVETCRVVPRHAPRKPGKPGEYELPDAVKILLENGREVLAYYACEDVLDLTRAEDIAIVSEQIRKNLVDSIEELNTRYSRLQ
jgi:dTDP-glucose pyrophosphorylase